MLGFTPGFFAQFDCTPLSSIIWRGVCLEYRNLLRVITGILATPGISLAMRLVAADLVQTQAQRISTGQLLDEAAPVVSDIKAVSERLGIQPAEIRRAYEQLAELGGVQILARQFPKRREQP